MSKMAETRARETEGDGTKARISLHQREPSLEAAQSQSLWPSGSGRAKRGLGAATERGGGAKKEGGGWVSDQS